MILGSQTAKMLVLAYIQIDVAHSEQAFCLQHVDGCTCSLMTESGSQTWCPGAMRQVR